MSSDLIADLEGGEVESDGSTDRADFVRGLRLAFASMLRTATDPDVAPEDRCKAAQRCVHLSREVDQLAPKGSSSGDDELDALLESLGT